MICELISKFENLSDATREAIQSDKLDHIRELDTKVVGTWDEILLAEPVCTDDKLVLAEFLFGQLTGEGELRETDKQIKNKLLQLISSPCQ